MFLFTYLRGFWYYLQVTITNKVRWLEPHYTTWARDFALNVRRHLDLSVGKSGGFLLAMDMKKNNQNRYH